MSDDIKKLIDEEEDEATDNDEDIQPGKGDFEDLGIADLDKEAKKEEKRTGKDSAQNLIDTSDSNQYRAERVKRSVKYVGEKAKSFGKSALGFAQKGAVAFKNAAEKANKNQSSVPSKEKTKMFGNDRERDYYFKPNLKPSSSRNMPVKYQSPLSGFRAGNVQPYKSGFSAFGSNKKRSYSPVFKSGTSKKAESAFKGWGSVSTKPISSGFGLSSGMKYKSAFKGLGKQKKSKSNFRW